MTEAQRNYLADLASRKGVRLDGVNDRSVAWASAKIEELKSLPDKTFDGISSAIDLKINKKITSVINEVSKWTFQA